MRLGLRVWSLPSTGCNFTALAVETGSAKIGTGDVYKRQLLAFAVARNCGRPLLSLLFSEKLIAKYSDWTEQNNRFARLFALAIFFPVAPDDFLCYLAGTTSMTWRRFTAIILLGKPLSIALYSLGLTVLFQQITGWLR